MFSAQENNNSKNENNFKEAFSEPGTILNAT